MSYPLLPHRWRQFMGPRARQWCVPGENGRHSKPVKLKLKDKGTAWLDAKDPGLLEGSGLPMWPWAIPVMDLCPPRDCGAL